MSAAEKVRPASAAELRQEIRRQLPLLDPELRIVAEDFMGLASPIDLLAISSRGEVVLILLSLEGENDAALLTRCLAQRAWAAPRLRDWAQLAPELEIAADTPIRVILLAPDFGSETLAAAASLRPGVVQLVRHVSLRVGGQPGLLFEPIGDEVHAASPRPPETREPLRGKLPGALPSFRSGLSDNDLSLKPAPEESFDD